MKPNTQMYRISPQELQDISWKACVIVTSSKKSYKKTKAKWNVQLINKLIGCVFHKEKQIACDEKLTKSWQNDRVSFP